MVAGRKRTVNRNGQPELSIITVVHNAAGMLPGFFENVAPYLTNETELIILDGASTDGTLGILKQHYHLITLWQSEPDNGIYDAMNKAAKLAKGKWLYFMGADDRLLGGFGNVLKYLQNQHTIYYGKVVVWGEVWDKPFTKYGLTKIALCHQSIFYPAGVFKKYKYDTRYKVYADQHLNLACYADKQYKWQFIDELIAVYDTRGFTSALSDELHRQDFPRAIKKYLGWWVYLRYRFRKYKEHKNKP